MQSSRSPRSRVAGHIDAIPRSGIRDFFDIVSARKDAISLGVGEPGFQTPWHIRDTSIVALERGATGYTSNLGLPTLRSSIAEYVAGFFGISYSPESEILVTTGVSEALDLAVRATVSPGDEVIYHEPSYVSYAPVIQLAHGIPVPVAGCRELGFQLDPDELKRKIGPRTRAIILNFPNNPTGASLSISTLQCIAQLAVEYDLLVISDEIYAELTYEGEHVSLAALPGMRERTILLHGFSKAWAMTGFRIGYSCAPPDLTEAMMTIHQYTMLCAPTLGQMAANEALKECDRDVPEMRRLFALNRNFMGNCLKEMGLPFSPLRGAFYAFPCIEDLGLSSDEFALRLLDEENVAVVPGPAFGKPGEGFIRCSYATSLDGIKEAMCRMGRFVERLRGH